MINSKKQAATLDVLDFLAAKKVIRLYPDDQNINSNILTLRDQKTVHFGSCSYLGLEFDPRLIDGSIKATQNFGTQFSISRAYMSCPLYQELEDNFRAVFGKPCIITPTTTLGHLSAIPVLVNEDDAIILDHQVHSSVQMAVQMVKANGVTIQMIRHNRMDMLEDRIKKLRVKHKKIWYMADGIYSMYGDKAPLDEIYALMDKYPELHLYIDDAHGMSCYGKNGEGYVLGHGPINDRTVVTLSLAKAFGSGGAVFVFPTEEMAHRVQQTGLPLITGGPIQPSVLGSSIASSRLHLNPEIQEMQEDLYENIKYTNILLKKNQLPLISENDTPIFFIGAGLPKTARNIVDRMINEGVYQNVATFPAVPIKNAGIRFTITRLHTFEQIEHMVETMAHNYPLALEEEQVTMNQVCKSFKIPAEDFKIEKQVESLSKYGNLSVEHFETIHQLDKKEWDSLFSFNRQLSHNQLSIFEKSYSGHSTKENNWEFDYVKIKSPEGKVIIASPLFTILQKDDFLHPDGISKSIEVIRKKDPYYLTSRVLSSGSPVNIGQSIYIDNDSTYLSEAIQKFTNILTKIQEKRNTKTIMLRDFITPSKKIKETFQQEGFILSEILTTNIVDNIPNSEAAYRASLSKKSRKNIRVKIDANSDKFEYEKLDIVTAEDVELYYELYLSVARRKHEINGFEMPLSFFQEIVSSNEWEVHRLNDAETKDVVAVIFIHTDRVNNRLTPNYLGISDAYLGMGVYHIILYNLMTYSIKNDYTSVDLGATCNFEKSRFGATNVPIHALIQAEDHYNQTHMETVHQVPNQSIMTS